MNINRTSKMRRGKRQEYPRWKLHEINKDLFNALVITRVWTGDPIHGSAEEAANKIEKILKEAADMTMPRARSGTNIRRNVYW